MAQPCGQPKVLRAYERFGVHDSRTGSIPVDIQREADAWCHTYNHHRRNRGRYMPRRRPADLLQLT